MSESKSCPFCDHKDTVYDSLAAMDKQQSDQAGKALMIGIGVYLFRKPLTDLLNKLLVKRQADAAAASGNNSSDTQVY